MKVLENLTAKDVRVALNHNVGLTELTIECACSPEQLEKKLVSLFKHDHAEIFKKLRRNDRLRHPSHRDKVPAKPVTRDPVVIPVDFAKGVAHPEMESEPVKTPVLEDSEATLAQLKAMESYLSDTVKSDEADYYRLRAQAGDKRKELAAIRDSIGALQGQLATLQEQCRDTVGEANEIVARMNVISETLASRRGNLEQIRERIREREQVTLCVAADGISLLEERDFVMNDTGFDELFAELVNNDLCADLKVRDIKLLARVTRIVENSEGNRSLAVLFDNSELEAAYQLLSEVRHPDEQRSTSTAS